MQPDEPNETIDVATGGRPVEAVTAAALKLTDQPGPLRVTVSHDRGCPCAEGRPLTDCTCEIVGLVGRTIR